MDGVRISIDRDRIGEFCGKWRIKEFSLFGSVLRDDFRPDSDVDILVTFDPDAPWTLWDHMDMQDELARVFGRKVDLKTPHCLSVYFRDRVLQQAQVIYDAA